MGAPRKKRIDACTPARSDHLQRGEGEGHPPRPSAVIPRAIRRMQAAIHALQTGGTFGRRLR